MLLKRRINIVPDFMDINGKTIMLKEMLKCALIVKFSTIQTNELPGIFIFHTVRILPTLLERLTISNLYGLLILQSSNANLRVN